MRSVAGNVQFQDWRSWTIAINHQVWTRNLRIRRCITCFVIEFEIASVFVTSGSGGPACCLIWGFDCSLHYHYAGENKHEV